MTSFFSFYVLSNESADFFNYSDAKQKQFLPPRKNDFNITQVLSCYQWKYRKKTNIDMAKIAFYLQDNYKSSRHFLTGWYKKLSKFLSVSTLFFDITIAYFLLHNPY